MIAAVGSERLGVKFSPRIKFNDVEENDADVVYPYIMSRLNEQSLAYIHVMAFTKEGWHAKLRPLYKGAFFAGGGFTKETGEALLESGGADAIVYGTPHVANPDLLERFRRNAPLNIPDQTTFYTPGERGYTDYPVLEEATELNA